MKMPYMTLDLLKATFALVLLLCFWASVVSAQEARNPFSEPERRINPYQYGKAIRMVTLKGIVRTENFHGCLVRVGDMESLVVLKPDEFITLEHEGLRHMFSVSAIKEKSVVFEDKEGQTYEVLIR